MSGRCSKCGVEFTYDKKKKTYHRVKLLLLTSPQTAQTFTNSTPDENSFICMQCKRILIENTRPTSPKGRKRTWGPSISLKSPKKKCMRRGTPKKDDTAQDSSTILSGSTEATTPSSRKTLHREAIDLLYNYRYLKGFRLLLKIKVVRDHMMTAIKELLLKERQAMLTDKEGPFFQTVSQENLGSFSWRDTLFWAEEKAPITMGCLRAMFPPVKDLKRRSVGRPKTGEEAQHIAHQCLERRTGLVLSVVLYTCSNSTMKFVQSCMSVEMWRQGCSQKMFHTLNSLGISQSLTTARSMVDKLMLDKLMVDKLRLDKLRVDNDGKLQVWKKAVENTTVKRRPTFDSPRLQPSSAYSITWDNVQIPVHADHQSISHGNKTLMWALCFAQKNKVNFNHLEGDRKMAVDVSPYVVLPTPEVYSDLRDRMKTIVMRIIADNWTALGKVRGKVVRHIPHEYSDEMAEKSDIINLGVVDASLCSADGVSEVMEHLHSYVPVVNGAPFPILCCGDGLCVDRMTPCHGTQSLAGSAAARPEGLVESPQEFRREMLLLQDTMDLLFTQKSVSARGTLYQLKNYFKRKSLKRDVKDNFQNSWDMLELATGAYTTLLATTLCGTTSLKDVPSDFPEYVGQQMEWLSNLAGKVLDFCWMPADYDDICKAASEAASKEESAVSGYCLCSQEKDEIMIQCCSAICKGQRFHLSCVGLTEEPEEDGEWYCSSNCREDRSYVYCRCQTKMGEKMVQCHLKNKCLHHVWYHVSCLLPSERENLDGTWYCSEDCLFGAEGEDGVQNYSKALLWEGLCHLTKRDAVREGEGPAVVAMWKTDMVHFWNRKHHTYFRNGHHMLIGIGGFHPPNLGADLTWNRLANLSGCKGGNIGLDLVNEMLNTDFKDVLAHSRGSYTEKKVQRCAEIGGAMGKDLDLLFTEAELGEFSHATSGKSCHKKSQAEDIAIFVSAFQKDALFSYVPGRFHTGLQDFKYTTSIREPERMGQKILQLSKDMDLWH